MQNLDEANRMLDAFASVGAVHFDVTFLDIDGAKRGFRREQSVVQLRNSLPKLLPGLTERQNNLIVRPIPMCFDTVLVQLDDLDATALERVKDIAFLTLATSPGNHQAWVALQVAQEQSKSAGDAGAKNFARRLRKGIGADATASGATRLAGTLNYKRKYEPDFPTVSIQSVTTGRHVTPEQLETLGLVAAPEPVRIPPLRVSTSRSWPDYERCVQGAPPKQDGSGPDISRADFMWCLMAAQRGHGIEEIAARLMELSMKAQENGEQYARLTAENASSAVVGGKRGRG